MQIRCLYLSTNCSLSYCTKLPAHARIVTIFLRVTALQAELAEQNAGVRLTSYSHSGLMQAADLELKELMLISHSFPLILLKVTMLTVVGYRIVPSQLHLLKHLHQCA